MGDQPINIFMPTIFWHDRQGILSIDVLQQKQTFAGQNDDYIDVPMYKVATASMQKEIRVWNFHFDPSQQIDQQKKQTAEQQPKAMPTPLLTPKAAEAAANNEVNAEEEDVEIMELEVLEVIPKKVIMEQIEQQASQTKTKTQLVPEVPMMQQSLSVEFLANLEGHRSTTNVVRFSPDGSFLASGDADGSVLVWKLQSCAEKMELDTPATSNGEKKDEANKQPQQPGKSNGVGTRSMMEPEMDIPANKENWVRVTRASIHHERNGDITGICFSPDSQFIASVSMYETMVVSRADNGKRLWTKSSYRHFANGITWDPRGKYLITLSTDRRMDVLDAQRGTMLRCCYQAELPTTRLPSTNDNTEIVQQTYKLFHDDQLFTFQRGVEFSPCGGVVFAPAAHLEVGTHNVYGAYVFRRADLSLCQPTHLLPTIRPTIQVKCSPVLYQLQEGPNLLGLPHRLIFAVLCRDSLLLYNSQSESPFVFVENLHYDQLTSIAWTPDGRVLVVSSLEGFNSFIRMDARKLGVPCEKQPDFVAMQLEEQQRQQAEAMAQQMQALKTPIKDGESAQPREQTTPQHQAPPPFISLLDSPKLITPRRPRIKKKLNTPQLLLPVPMETDGATENFEPKQQDMEEKTEPEATAAPTAMTTDHQSPKMLVPRKKPRKVAVIPMDVGNGGEEAAAKN